MKTKTLLLTTILCGLGFFILLVSAGAIWWMLRPQTIAFSDDAKVTLLKVDYGKRHVPPVVKASATTAAPGRPARTARGSTFTTTNDTLVLWVRQQYDSSGNQYHGFQYYLYDKDGVACVGGSEHWGNGGRRGNDIVGIEFDAFPRHSGKFHVSVTENGNGNNETADKKFAVSNPARGPFATWTAESLPDMQQDDDLSVTLTKLVANVQSSANRGDADASDAINKAVQATFHVERNGKAVSNWHPVSIETSDATGNHVKTSVYSGNSWMNGSGNDNWQNGDDIFTYQYGLWPDEPVWKLRVEFSQQANFADDEIWTLGNVPLQSGSRNNFWNYNNRAMRTNAPYSETDLNGVHVKLFSPQIFSDASPNSNPQGGFYIQISPPLPDGMRMNLVSLTDNQTNDIQHWENTWNFDRNTTLYRCDMQDIVGLTNINLSIAVHKSRFVEFTVKPEKAPAVADSGQ